jgi:hypothetical protein
MRRCRFAMRYLAWLWLLGCLGPSFRLLRVPRVLLIHQTFKKYLNITLIILLIALSFGLKTITEGRICLKREGKGLISSVANNIMEEDDKAVKISLRGNALQEDQEHKRKRSPEKAVVVSI